MQKPQHSHCLQSIISTTALFKFSVHNRVWVCIFVWIFGHLLLLEPYFWQWIQNSWKKHSFIWLCFFSVAHFRYTNGVLLFFGICFYLVIVPLTFHSVLSSFFFASIVYYEFIMTLNFTVDIYDFIAWL